MKKSILISLLMLFSIDFVHAQSNIHSRNSGAGLEFDSLQLSTNGTDRFYMSKTKMEKQNYPELQRETPDVIATAGFNDHNYDFEDIYFVDSNTGWAIDWKGYVLKTDDGGETWRFQDNLYAGPRALYFLDTNNGWIVGGGYVWGITPKDNIWYTTNGGTTWRSRSSETPDSLDYPLEDVHFVDTDNGWAVGKNGWIIHSSNGGINWTTQAKGGNSFYGVCFVSKSEGWAVGSSGTILHTEDAGLTWEKQQSDTWRTLRDVDFVDSSHGWIAGYDGKILYTDNGGRDWHEISKGDYDYKSIDFISRTHGWIAGSDGMVLRTSDGGSTWKEVKTDGKSLIAISFPTQDKGWVIGNYGILASTDGGRNWSYQFKKLSGYVKNTAGEGLEDAKIVMNEEYSFFTNYRGEWSFWEKGGTYFVSASHPWYIGTDSKVIQSDTSLSLINLVLPDNVYKVSGRVSGEEKKYVSLKILRTDIPGTSPELDADSDDNGYWEIHLPRGTYKIIPYRYGYGFRPPYRIITVEGEYSNLDFSSEVLYVIEGEVRNEKNSGLSNALVTIIGEGDTLSIKTSYDGKWQAKVIAGTYDIAVNKFGYRFPQKTLIEVTADLQDIIIIPRKPLPYYEDFSSEPYFIPACTPSTDDIFKWDTVNESYQVRLVTDRKARKYAYTPEFQKIEEGAFEIQLDLKPVEASSGSPIGIWIFDSDSSIDKSIQFNYKNSPKFEIGDGNGHLYTIEDVTEDTWYTLKLRYYHSSGTADLLATETNTGKLLSKYQGLVFQPVKFSRGAFGWHTQTVTGTVAEMHCDNISIKSINEPPKIISSAIDTAVEHRTYEYIAKAIDPEGSVITYAFQNHPNWLAPTDSVISGTPPEGALDSSFVVIASDGELPDTLFVTVKVVPVNDPPILISLNAVTAYEDSLFKYIANAIDPEGSVVSYTFQNYPVWLTSADSIISGIPPEGSQDTSFVVIASDGELTDTLFVTLTVVTGTKRFWADIDGDNDVDVVDIQIVAGRWNTKVGDPYYDLICDVDNEGQGDGDIDIVDIQLVAGWWNKPIPPGSKSSTLAKASGDVPENVTLRVTSPIPRSESHGSYYIDVMIKNATNLGAFQFDIVSKDKGLNIERIELGSFLKKSQNRIIYLGPERDIERNRLTFGAYSYGKNPGASGSGVLARIKLTSSSYGVLSMKLDNVKTTDINGNLMLINRIVHASVSDAELSTVPQSFSLSQNYPNPFNPETTIEYQTPKRSKVNIKIYNFMGQEIVTMVNEEQEAGYFKTIWDGKDSFGKQVASGIYVYKMIAGDFAMSKKLVFIR